MSLTTPLIVLLSPSDQHKGTSTLCILSIDLKFIIQVRHNQQITIYGHMPTIDLVN